MRRMSSTSNYVQELLERYCNIVVFGDGVAVRDDAEEMNWRIFFAHSQDMQGFRADIFTGGRDEPEHRYDPHFVPLRLRWAAESTLLVNDLACLWEDDSTRDVLVRMSNPVRPIEERAKGIAPALHLLVSSDRRGARVFGYTLRDFSGPNVSRKTNGMIRSYIQNSHLLKQHDCSYRSYLLSLIPGGELPAGDVSAAERTWVKMIQHDFYNVGPALANYLICDWLLWFWREGRVEWFESYKCDSVYKRLVRSGRLPTDAINFVNYCKTVKLPQCYRHLSGKPCPPRVLNECIWLDNNRSSA